MPCHIFELRWGAWRSSEKGQECGIRSSRTWQHSLGAWLWKRKLLPFHTHTYTCRLTHSVIHIYKYSQKHIHTCSLADILTHKNTPAYTYKHSHTETYLYIHVHASWALCRLFPKSYLQPEPSSTTSALMIRWSELTSWWPGSPGLNPWITPMPVVSERNDENWEVRGWLPFFPQWNCWTLP